MLPGGRIDGSSWRSAGAAIALAAILVGHAVPPLGASQQVPPPPAGPPVVFVDPSSAPRPVAVAVRTEQSIVLDGRLDEPAWETAQPIGNFIQSQPNRGLPATEQTVVRILFDDRNLYMGIMNLDSRPENLVVRSLERDFGGSSPQDIDAISITIDPFLDRRNSFLLHVNPVGAVRDAQTTDNGRTQNPAWRGVWFAEASVTDSGWVAELAIPWTTLRFDPQRGEQIWGLNFRRRVRWKNEESAWAPLERHEQSHRMSRAGTLLGLEGMRPGRNLGIKPFALVAFLDGDLLTPDQRAARWDGGVDLKYGLTPRLTVDLTYRTDFSQAEDDQEQVNLTRFSLFRPERRDFFLENSAVFAFGDVTERSFRMRVSPQDFTMFHTRRIGLTSDGRTIPIVAGGRVTGRVGPLQVGLLNMQTEAARGGPAENFSVARIRGSIGSGSDVGAILVHRTSTGGEHADGGSPGLGVDANLRPHPSMVINSYLARGGGSEGRADDLAWRMSVGWRDRLWDASLLARQVDDDFRPSTGFVRRRGIRQHYGTVGVHVPAGFVGAQETNPYLEVDVSLDPTGALEDRLVAAGVATEFRDGGVFDLSGSQTLEVLSSPFPIPGAGGTEVPAGRHAMGTLSVGYAASRARRLSGGIRLGGGDYYGGERRSVEAGVHWQPGYRFFVDLTGEHNRVTVPSAGQASPSSVTADILALRTGYSYSRSLFGRASLQYNSLTRQLVSNFRLNFIHAPLSDLFVVVAERRDLDSGVVLERALTLKVTRLLVF